MKYIKIFESYLTKPAVSTSELKGYCDTYLAYLYDKEYVITLIRYDKKYYKSEGFYFRMSLKRDPDLYKTKISKEFYWNDVKDQFMPFLHQLKKDYNLDNLLSNDKHIRFLEQSYGSTTNYEDYSIKEILNDQVRNKKVVEIVFHVKDEI